uniref:Uncharacterized protein n=1 Tax=Ixodes ricinus TaxID=34613 RepID=V5HPN4_IXORI
MATPNTARIIDLETDQSEAQASLQFQDFSDTLTGATGALPGQAYTSFSVMNDDDEESDELLNRGEGGTRAARRARPSGSLRTTRACST